MPPKDKAKAKAAAADAPDDAPEAVEPEPIEPPDPDSVIASEVGVPAEYADPEPDEEAVDATGGDLVQLIRTGWVRLVIGGHGRVRLRPPRLGELRHVMLAYEAMIDEVQERAHANQALADGLNAEIVAMNEPGSEVTPEEKHAKLVEVTKRSRHANREFTIWREDQYLAWWTMVQAGDGERFNGLGVSGEKMPDLDGMPVWIAVPALATAVLAHWTAVPLDRGRR